MKRIIAFTAISALFLAQNIFASTKVSKIEVKAFAVADTTWVSWMYNDAKMFEQGVVVLTSQDGNKWKPLNKKPVIIQYDTVVTNELLPKVFVERAKKALKQSQFNAADIKETKEQYAKLKKGSESEKQMVAAFTTSSWVPKYGYLSGAVLGLSGAVIGAPAKYVGLGYKGSQKPVATVEVQKISSQVTVKSVAYQFPAQKIYFYLEDPTAGNTSFDKGRPSYHVHLTSVGNNWEGSLIPLIDVWQDSVWAPDIYTSSSGWKYELGEHVISYGKDIMGQKIRVTPTVLGVYPGEPREVLINNLYSSETK